MLKGTNHGNVQESDQESIDCGPDSEDSRLRSGSKGSQTCLLEDGSGEVDPEDEEDSDEEDSDEEDSDEEDSDEEDSDDFDDFDEDDFDEDDEDDPAEEDDDE